MPLSRCLCFGSETCGGSEGAVQSVACPGFEGEVARGFGLGLKV